MLQAKQPDGQTRRPPLKICPRPFCANSGRQHQTIPRICRVVVHDKNAIRRKRWADRRSNGK
jgi:hypothetical protein